MSFWSKVKKVANAVTSVVASAGHVVEGIMHVIASGVRAIGTGIDKVRQGLAWTNSWLCLHGGAIACRAGNILLGAVSGYLKAFSDLINKGADALDHLGSFLGAILRLDFPGAISDLGLLVMDAAEILIDFLRGSVGLTAIAGIIDQWQAEDLRRFVEDLLKSKFGSDPARLARIREHLGLDEVTWGLPIEGKHFVYCLDSELVSLWEWHQQGTIDLYAMAHLLSFDSFSFGRTRTSVRKMDASGNASTFPATRSDIAAYLESKGSNVRLRVFSLSNTAIKEFTSVAAKKHARIGIRLSWNTDDLELGDLPPFKTITLPTEYKSPFLLEPYVVMRGWRAGTREEQCDALVIAAFKTTEHVGWTFGRSIMDGASVTPCQADRDDNCCNEVKLRGGSGVIYHDQYPSPIFRYVPAHELGHYVGLCHWKHDGFQNIMFTPEPSAKLHWVWSRGMLWFLIRNEPEFSLADGKNAWRFLVAEMAPCLEPHV